MLFLRSLLFFLAAIVTTIAYGIFVLPFVFIHYNTGYDLAKAWGRAVLWLVKIICGIDYQVIRVDQGEPLPTTAGDLAGLVSIGGAMGANDPLPWIADELRLMRAADAARVPVAGHCLGAQLMARAFGATVTKNPVREHGWAELTIDNPALAREWLGDCADTPITALQWHADTFSLPPGALHSTSPPRIFATLMLRCDSVPSRRLRTR